jgi:N-acetylmuramoyl-L-alanine amidase
MNSLSYGRKQFLFWAVLATVALQGCAHKKVAQASNVAADLPSSPAANKTAPSASDAPAHMDPGSETPSNSQTFRVALDIGHTPRVGGAVGADGTMEYDFNKHMVRLLAADLKQQKGISVLTINEEGAQIGLARRSAIANKASADLFLAIHHDSANDRYLVPVESGGATHYQTTRFHGYSVFFSKRNPHPEESLIFAKALGAAMRKEGLVPTAHHAEKIPGENRELVDPELGVYRFDDLIVLRTANMPAALLECGVIVNPDEEKELKQPERQSKTVRAVRSAVLQMEQSRR